MQCGFSLRAVVVSYRNSTSNHNLDTRFHLGGRVVSYRNSTSNHNHTRRRCIECRVVSYRNSTSNHNVFTGIRQFNGLYLIEILHQTTTTTDEEINLIKLYLIEILHQTTTAVTTDISCNTLYLIEILHQTTTVHPVILKSSGCILSKFYIKPQHRIVGPDLCLRCILSKFYIKPQQSARHPKTP